MEDVNFDGYLDIKIQGESASGPNVPYYFFLWNKDSSKYIEDKELKAIISPEVDNKSSRYQSKTVSVYHKGNC